MKRHKHIVLPVLLVLFLTVATALAQSPTRPPQDRRLELSQQQLQEVQNLLGTLQADRQRGGGAASLNGAWWTNTALVQQLGLTDDQKAKIEKAYENHRQNIVSSTQVLDKEEAQLARLLDSDSID